MKVRAVWEFDVDTEGLDGKFVDIKGLAKDLTKRELANLIENHELSAEDFTFNVVEEKAVPVNDKNDNELTFEEEVNNVIGCMEYWEKRVGEYVMELNESSLSEDECVMEDTQKALEFIRKIPAIISGACVLAAYAGEDWASNEDKYGFGADSYEYTDKYIKGAMELAEVYGTEDFHNDYSDYFRKHICPTSVEERKSIAAKEERRLTVLYNAIATLINETIGQYDDSEEWFNMIQKELDCTKEELLELGIDITSNGGLATI